MTTVNAAAVFAAFCLLPVSCKEKENQDIENRLSPTPVSMPKDSSVLFTKLGFSYSTLEDAELKIATILDSSSSHRNVSWINTNDELTELIKNDPAYPSCTTAKGYFTRKTLQTTVNEPIRRSRKDLAGTAGGTVV